MNKRVDRLNDI